MFPPTCVVLQIKILMSNIRIIKYQIYVIYFFKIPQLQTNCDSMVMVTEWLGQIWTACLIRALNKKTTKPDRTQ